ncbi:LysR family transcriptional regulator, glycine cleavage system transcriptional activator [Rhizobium sp. RU20A]|uniref:LysR family transcriptional regulator n=1 Tax=Rhizobium sp. RU20A TaxID=1907412 RepID=UPI0009561B4A|nr:LysR family transcriptional regulator [Rhizobium sp. RU20A]SIR40869.1 LysR family transcriptional regulator, glycine cleavage system transcriptional activator [Rhizobium sp. RU20A]
MKLSRRLAPDVITLQAFECAARHGSFTQAATELNLTQSAVSRQIKDLELQLGVLLFERIRQRVVLSEAGRRFLPEVRRLLAQAEELMVRTMAAARADQSLSLACLPTFGSRWLMPRLPDFLARHPDTIVNIASRSQPFDFEEQTFDLAIHYGQPVWAHATCTYLCSETIVPVASPALIRTFAPQTYADLDGAPLLHMATRPKLWALWFGDAGVDPKAAYRGHRFDQFSTVIEAALAGLGFALVPLYLIGQDIAANRLQVVFDKPFRTENNYYVVVPNGKQENPVSVAFRSWIAGEVSASPDAPAILAGD